MALCRRWPRWPGTPASRYSGRRRPRRDPPTGAFHLLLLGLQLHRELRPIHHRRGHAEPLGRAPRARRPGVQRGQRAERAHRPACARWAGRCGRRCRRRGDAEFLRHRRCQHRGEVARPPPRQRPGRVQRSDGSDAPGVRHLSRSSPFRRQSPRPSRQACRTSTGPRRRRRPRAPRLQPGRSRLRQPVLER